MHDVQESGYLKPHVLLVKYDASLTVWHYLCD